MSVHTFCKKNVNLFGTWHHPSVGGGICMPACLQLCQQLKNTLQIRPKLNMRVMDRMEKETKIFVGNRHHEKQQKKEMLNLCGYKP